MFSILKMTACFCFYMMRLSSVPCVSRIIEHRFFNLTLLIPSITTCNCPTFKIKNALCLYAISEQKFLASCITSSYKNGLYTLYKAHGPTWNVGLTVVAPAGCGNHGRHRRTSMTTALILLSDVPDCVLIFSVLPTS